MPDQVSTPASLAMMMAESSTTHPSDERDYIADFAAGDGQLLKAAMRQWPHVRFVATDVDPQTIRSLRLTQPNWIVGRCDFLNQRSRQACSALRGLSGTVSLVLLNPPFSCRGAKRVTATLLESRISCSVALAFVINSVEFLRPNGEIVAILPAGSLESEKDEPGWEALGSMGTVTVLSTNGYRAFPGGSVRTVIVRFSLGHTGHAPESNGPGVEASLERGTAIGVRMVRGTLPMNRVHLSSDAQGIPLVHTTELRPGALDLAKRRVRQESRRVSGPMVLLPRVGNPSVRKIVLHCGEEPFVLSDCVVALLCATTDEARMVYSALTKHWAVLEQNYVGSCARYITLRRVAGILDAVGFVVERPKGGLMSSGFAPAVTSGLTG